jgi:hypothetical protein
LQALKNKPIVQPATAPVSVPSADRRRHTRFGTETFHGTLWLVRHGRSATVKYEPCQLVNLSYGGVGFRSSLPLRKRAVCWALVELTAPFRDAALATLRVCWVRPVPSCAEFVAGARFLQTNKGWVGDEEQVVQ